MNLAAYCLQIAIVAAAGAALPVLLRLRSPKPLLIYWQSLLALCLLSPFLPPWQQAQRGLIDLSWSVVSAAGSTAAASTRSWIPQMLLAILAAGAVARLAWVSIGYARLVQFRRTAVPVHPLPPVLRDLSRRLDVDAAFYISNDLHGPASFGIYPSVVLFPATWLAMDDQHQTVVACHELLHVHRRDWLFHITEELLRAAFWFHPAAWWIVNRIRLTREQVVDQDVVRLTQARDTYLEALLSVAEVNAAAACFSQKHQLKSRIEAIVKEISMSRFRTAVSMAAVAICLAGVTRFAASSFPLQAENKSAGKVYRASDDGVTRPKLVYKIEPAYTPEARDAGVEGTVKLAVEVTADGVAQNIDVVQSLDPGLDKNAVSAVEQWRFQPATKDGKPVTVSATIEINFRLQ